jgi:hypothetical protein
MEPAPNTPRLAEPAPWDPVCPVGRRRPKDLWKRCRYVSRYGVYWVPTRMDSWTYKELLRDLDPVAIRTLTKHEALTAKELAERLNKEKRFHTKPKRTGISQVTSATTYAWLELANRRGLVAACQPSASRAVKSRTHWELTEKGREAIRPRFWVLLGRLYLLLPALLVSGLLFAAVEWFSEHPGAVVWIVLSLPVVLEIAGLAFWHIRSEAREAPGVAVVAIETWRGSGKPLPALAG